MFQQVVDRFFPLYSTEQLYNSKGRSHSVGIAANGRLEWFRLGGVSLKLLSRESYSLHPLFPMTDCASP